MNVVMPQLGETVAEGTVGAWFKNPGDPVQEGETLFEIETDKTTMEVQALASGRLVEIRVQAGTTVPVGTIVAVIGEAGAAVEAAKPAPPPPAAPAAPMPAAPAASPPAAKAPQAVARDLDPFQEVRTPAPVAVPRTLSGIKVTPLARRLIVQSGVEVDALSQHVARKGGKRIGRDQVIEFLAEAPGRAVEAASAAEARAPAPPPPSAPAAVEPPRAPAAGESDLVPLNRMRKRSGENLARAWREVPHVTQGVEVNFQRVERARAAWNAKRAASDVKLTYLPFIARAVCLAIRDYPQINASLEEDQLRIHRRINLGIAVDLDHEGLLVPVVRAADDLTVAGLARGIDAAIARARSGRLNADDLAGPTYSLSNSGTFGTLFTAPIVNPPQVAILSTDGVAKRPIVVEDEDGERIGIGRVGVLAQSFDHRAFDGAYSAAFLRRLRQIIETRDWLAEI